MTETALSYYLVAGLGFSLGVLIGLMSELFNDFNDRHPHKVYPREKLIFCATCVFAWPVIAALFFWNSMKND